MGKRWRRWDTGIRMHVRAYKGNGETNMGGICHQVGEHDMITRSDENMGFNASHVSLGRKGDAPALKSFPTGTSQHDTV